LFYSFSFFSLLSPMTSFFSIVLVLCFFFSCVTCQTPIPTRPDGYGYGSPSAPVVFEAFLDLLCPDSAASWPVLQQVMYNYESNLYFLFHTFPLPYHTYSFIANQGMHVVAHASNNSISLLYQYATLMFNQQTQFYNAPTMNLSTTQVINMMGKVVDSAKIITSDTFITGINDATINYETRVSWKYACSRGQVTGTPTFLLNGIYVDADASWTLADWKVMIDPLLSGVMSDRSTVTHKHVSMKQAACPSGETFCQYTPTKSECCLAGENCIPNVGCRCLTDTC